MIEESQLHPAIEMTPEAIRLQLLEIVARQPPLPGKRQERFNHIELLLCYGLFYIVDPHRYGGRNIHLVSDNVQRLAIFCKRPVSSLTNKMLNLEGARKNGARDEPLLFAQLSNAPERYRELYQCILTLAREMTINEQTLPDFLGMLDSSVSGAIPLLGQDELPSSNSALLIHESQEIEALDRVFKLDTLTETLVERKVRLTQHRFAADVLKNCARRCVFCGFEPRTLRTAGGLLRASHIKPWRDSTAGERMDVRNGLAACAIHDAAFDQGYLTVDPLYHIVISKILHESIEHDPGVDRYFADVANALLHFPARARKPRKQYLEYHQRHVFLKPDNADHRSTGNAIKAGVQPC